MDLKFTEEVEELIAEQEQHLANMEAYFYPDRRKYLDYLEDKVMYQMEYAFFCQEIQRIREHRKTIQIHD